MVSRAVERQGDPESPSPQAEGVTVIIPAYNEENGIGRVLDELHETMGSSGLEHEILVIDDGSTDGTAEIARRQGVRLLSHKTNMGYGGSLKTGILHARYPLIVITDADGTYPNERAPELVQLVTRGEADMAVGARTGANVAISWVRRPAKWVISRLAELAAGQRIQDLNSGLRVFRREVALRFLSLLPSGFSFTTTITLAMLTNGYTVEYLTIDYHERKGRSKIRPFQDTINFVLLILKIALYFAPLKIFLPLSGLLLLLSLGVGLYTALVVGRLADITTVLLAVSAVQIAAIGLLAELIDKRFPSNYKNG